MDCPANHSCQPLYHAVAWSGGVTPRQHMLDHGWFWRVNPAMEIVKNVEIRRQVGGKLALLKQIVGIAWPTKGGMATCKGLINKIAAWPDKRE